MSADRYVLLGLARVRATWFSEVSRWATSAMIPADFVKCVSVDDVRARLASGRAFSALLVDELVAGLERDLVDTARTAGCAVIIVHDGRLRRDWIALGASAALDASFERGDLLATLEANAATISHAEELPDTSAGTTNSSPHSRGALIAVTGPGGAGSSTTAMALAQGLARVPTNRHLVLLADLALDADLAMLHDARDVVPGVQELIESFRSGSPTGAELRSFMFDDAVRGHHLLLGLRRHRDWTSVRPRALEAALEGLLSTYRFVVADVDSDLEGSDETGSVEVEERNLLARTTIPRADVVVVTGNPGVKGTHTIVRTIASLLDHGVDANRILPALVRVPRAPRLKAEMTRALADLLTDPRRLAVAVNPPVFVSERRRLDEIIRDGKLLPDQLARPITAAVEALLARHEPEPLAIAEPVKVAPGSLGQTTGQGV